MTLKISPVPHGLTGRPLFSPSGRLVRRYTACCSYESAPITTLINPSAPGAHSPGDFASAVDPLVGTHYDAVEESAWCARVAVWCDAYLKKVHPEGNPDGFSWRYFKGGSILWGVYGDCPAEDGSQATLDGYQAPQYCLRLAKYCERHKTSRNQCDHSSDCRDSVPPCATCTEGPRPAHLDLFPVVWTCGGDVIFDFNYGEDTGVSNLHATNEDGDAGYAPALEALADVSAFVESGIGQFNHPVFVHTQLYRWRQQTWPIVRASVSDPWTRVAYPGGWPTWSDYGPSSVVSYAGCMVGPCIENPCEGEIAEPAGC